MQRVGIYPPGEYLPRCGLYGVVGSCQTGNGIQQDYYVVSAFYQTTGLVQNNLGNLYMMVGRLIERGGNHFSFYTPFHIGHLFRTFINEQNNHVYVRMIISNGIGNIFQQHGLTGLGCATIRPRCPFPMGENISTTRQERLSSCPFVRLNFSLGNNGFR